MLAVARPDKGRVGAIVSHGVLFRGGSEGRIRKRIIEEMCLDAVIGLPANFFYETAIPAAIILFNKGKRTGETLFIDASGEYEKGKRQNRLRDSDIRHIVETYTRFKECRLEPGILEERYAYIATLEEIRENDYNLNLPNYVDTMEKKETEVSQDIYEQINKLENELAEVQNQLAACLKKLNL